MQPVSSPDTVVAATPESAASDLRERTLPSGRSVVVKVAGQQEELEVRAPDGRVEVRITLTDAGPVVTLSGARLELDAADRVAVNCRTFEVRATETARLHSDGPVQITGQETSVQSEGDVTVKGAVIRLN